MVLEEVEKAQAIKLYEENNDLDTGNMEGGVGGAGGAYGLDLRELYGTGSYYM